MSYKRLFLNLAFFLTFHLSWLSGVPVITEVTPNAGPSSGGNVVTLSGSGFTGALAVNFGTTPALSFIVNSDTSITAMAPPAVFGTVDITINTPAGTSAVTPADRYVYQDNWTAYIANQVGEITPLDIPSNTVGAPIVVGGGPIDIAITPDGQRAYVSDLSLNRVDVINILTNTLLVAIPVGAVPIGVAITPDGQKVYVANSGSSSLSVIQVATNTILTTIPLPSTPFGVAITPDGTTAYVTVNGATSSIIPINTTTNAVGTPINLGAGHNLSFITITPDGTKAYVGSQIASPIFVIDLTTNTFLTSITLSSPAAVPYRIGITPDGTKGYSTNFTGENTVYPLDLLTNTAGTPIPDGLFPFGVAITPDGTTAYITNRSADTVVPIDIATNTAGAEIDVPPLPNFLAITPDQAPLASFVATVQNGTVFFDASASISPVGTIVSYAWDFGDGQTALTSSPFISHTYALSGSYNVTLIVTNSAGTSIFKVFTGTTMLRNGGINAIFTQLISVNVPSLTPLPPSHFIGQVVKNKFATQTDYIHQLFWSPVLDPSIRGYLIRRNGILIAIVDASGPFIYNDHNRKKHEIDAYTITSFNIFGESIPLNIVVP